MKKEKESTASSFFKLFGAVVVLIGIVITNNTWPVTNWQLFQNSGINTALYLGGVISFIGIALILFLVKRNR